MASCVCGTGQSGGCTVLNHENACHHKPKDRSLVCTRVKGHDGVHVACSTAQHDIGRWFDNGEWAKKPNRQAMNEEDDEEPTTVDKSRSLRDVSGYTRNMERIDRIISAIERVRRTFKEGKADWLWNDDIQTDDIDGWLGCALTDIENILEEQFSYDW